MCEREMSQERSKNSVSRAEGQDPRPMSTLSYPGNKAPTYPKGSKQ